MESLYQPCYNGFSYAGMSLCVLGCMVPDLSNVSTGFIFKSQQLGILASGLHVTAWFSDFMSTGVTLFLVPIYGFTAGGSF